MSDRRNSKPVIRRAQRLLLMVQELQKQGYHRLRSAPGMAPSGCYWRCGITPISNILVSHGAKWRSYKTCVHYSTSMDNNYFNWQDARQDTARQLAAKFIDRFPKIVEASWGSDWTYAGWYVEMMGFPERGHLPVAYADWELENNVLAKDGDRTLPWPPPGEAKTD